MNEKSTFHEVIDLGTDGDVESFDVDQSEIKQSCLWLTIGDLIGHQKKFPLLIKFVRDASNERLKYSEASCFT